MGFLGAAVLVLVVMLYFPSDLGFPGSLMAANEPDDHFLVLFIPVKRYPDGVV